jgi:hypothetical protein
LPRPGLQPGRLRGAARQAANFVQCRGDHHRRCTLFQSVGREGRACVRKVANQMLLRPGLLPRRFSRRWQPGRPHEASLGPGDARGLRTLLLTTWRRIAKEGGRGPVVQDQRRTCDSRELGGLAPNRGVAVVIVGYSDDRRPTRRERLRHQGIRRIRGAVPLHVLPVDPTGNHDRICRRLAGRRSSPKHGGPDGCGLGLALLGLVDHQLKDWGRSPRR